MAGKREGDREPDGESPRASMTRAGRAAAAGTEVVGLFVLGFLAGRYAADLWRLGPWPVAVGVVLGFGAGLWAAYRTLAGP
jgi:F0F1-type ATP synthase assembly protein I